MLKEAVVVGRAKPGEVMITVGMGKRTELRIFIAWLHDTCIFITTLCIITLQTNIRQCKIKFRILFCCHLPLIKSLSSVINVRDRSQPAWLLSTEHTMRATVVGASAGEGPKYLVKSSRGVNLSEKRGRANFTAKYCCLTHKQTSVGQQSGAEMQIKICYASLLRIVWTNFRSRRPKVYQR